MVNKNQNKTVKYLTSLSLSEVAVIERLNAGFEYMKTVYSSGILSMHHIRPIEHNDDDYFQHVEFIVTTKSNYIYTGMIDSILSYMPKSDNMCFHIEPIADKMFTITYLIRKEDIAREEEA